MRITQIMLELQIYFSLSVLYELIWVYSATEHRSSTAPSFWAGKPCVFALWILLFWVDLDYDETVYLLKHTWFRSMLKCFFKEDPVIIRQCCFLRTPWPFHVATLTRASFIYEYKMATFTCAEISIVCCEFTQPPSNFFYYYHPTVGGKTICIQSRVK